MIFKSLTAGLVFILVFGLLVFAQQMPSGATLRGRFIYEDSGLPLRRAWVGLTLIKSFPGADANLAFENSAYNTDYASNSNAAYGDEDSLVLTGDNGEFVMKDVQPGIYFPYVKQAGIFNPNKPEAENPNFRPITVIGDEVIELDFAVKRGGLITGRITYQDGSPALGIAVSTKRVDAEQEDKIQVARTDDRGIYRFPGLNNGEYVVFASEPVVHSDPGESQWDSQTDENSTNSMLRVYYPSVYSKKDSRPVNVRLGQDQPNIDIVIPNHPLATLAGVVISSNEKLPLQGYFVSFQKLDEEEDSRQYIAGGENNVATDENGKWTLRDLLPGKYILEASRTARYRLPIDRKEPGEKRYASVTKEIEIIEGVESNIVIELRPAASISGTIEFDQQPAENNSFSYMFVRATDIIQDFFDSTFVSRRDSEERQMKFELNNLRAGSYELDVSSFEGPYVNALMLNGEDITEAKITVKEGELVEGVKVILGTNFGTVAGRVTNAVVPNGRYVYLTSVDYSRASRGNAIDNVKSDGTFELKAKPGRYYLVTKEFVTGEERPTPDTLRAEWEKWVSGAEIVEVKARETIRVSVSLD